MPAVRELHADEAGLAAGALLELRPQYGGADEIAERVSAQAATGYRVIASFEDGERDAAAAAGFRILESLHAGRFLYVDDLVTRADRRGRGHADALFAHLLEIARDAGCGELHLDSGVQADRADAHRFYMRHGMRIASHHFSRSV